MQTELHRLAELGDADGIIRLLNNIAYRDRVSEKDMGGRTVLSIAFEFGQAEVLHKLLVWACDQGVVHLLASKDEATARMMAVARVGQMLENYLQQIKPLHDKSQLLAWVHSVRVFLHSGIMGLHFKTMEKIFYPIDRLLNQAEDAHLRQQLNEVTLYWTTIREHAAVFKLACESSLAFAHLQPSEQEFISNNLLAVLFHAHEEKLILFTLSSENTHPQMIIDVLNLTAPYAELVLSYMLSDRSLLVKLNTLYKDEFFKNHISQWYLNMLTRFGVPSFRANQIERKYKKLEKLMQAEAIPAASVNSVLPGRPISLQSGMFKLPINLLPSTLLPASPAPSQATGE